MELLQFLGMTESPSSMSLLLSAVGKLMRKDRDDLKEETTQTDFDNHRLCTISEDIGFIIIQNMTENSDAVIATAWLHIFSHDRRLNQWSCICCQLGPIKTIDNKWMRELSL